MRKFIDRGVPGEDPTIFNNRVSFLHPFLGQTYFLLKFQPFRYLAANGEHRIKRKGFFSRAPGR